MAAVKLRARCTGRSWLRRDRRSMSNPSLLSPLLARCASTRRQSNGRRRNNLTRMKQRFSCQATEILRAAPGTDPFLDYGAVPRGLEVGQRQCVGGDQELVVPAVQYLPGSRQASLLPRWLWVREGLKWGFVKGRASGRTPTGHLRSAGREVVRVKSKDEIAATLDSKCLNRGMGFEEEMARSAARRLEC